MTTDTMAPILHSALQTIHLQRLERAIAERAVVADIESEAYRCRGSDWLDVRPMLDLREHSGEVVDMGQQAIGYALARGLVERHPDPQAPHLVRVVRRPA